jgi:hypothetical protein
MSTVMGRTTSRWPFRAIGTSVKISRVEWPCFGAHSGRGVYTDLDADLVFRGSDQPDGFGMALWMVDANGDGDDELVVGAPFDGAPVSYRGAVYLFDPSTWSW